MSWVSVSLILSLLDGVPESVRNVSFAGEAKWFNREPNAAPKDLVQGSHLICWFSLSLSLLGSCGNEVASADVHRSK